VALLLGATGVAAQPALDTLWPNANGTKWTYDFQGWDLGMPPAPPGNWDGEATLTLAGTSQTAGGTAQNLVGWHTQETAPAKAATLSLPPLYRNLWNARPDLHAAITARMQEPGRVGKTAEGWVPLLLHEGFFMKLSDRIEMWQPSWDHSTWIYLTDALGNGQMFSKQLIPELANDVYLYGTVASNNASVTVPAGTFPNAVKITYLIDYGLSQVVNDLGQPIGTVRAHTTGWVHYVPGVGPVDMQEEFIPYSEVNCPAPECQSLRDQEGEVVLHLTMQLTAGPVAVEAKPWGAVKQLFR